MITKNNNNIHGLQQKQPRGVVKKNEKGGINRPPGVFDIRYVPCPWHWLSPSTDLRRGSSLPADH